MPAYQHFPPGYVSPRSLRGMLEGRAKFGMKDHWELTYEELVDEQYIIVGSPDTVSEKLAIYAEECGAGVHVGASMQVGDMPNWKVVKNMTLFAEEVMPNFRPAGQRAGLEARRAAARVRGAGDAGAARRRRSRRGEFAGRAH